MTNLLKKGRKIKLLGFGSLPKPFIHRLYGLGLYKGSIFSIAHISPLGCPIALQVGNTLLSLRLNEIDQMQLQIL